VLGKALGAGMPLGAFIAGSHILSALTHRPVLGHITTFGGHPASCAAAYAGLTVLLRDRLPEAAEAKGRYLQEKLHHPLIANIRGKGLFLAVEFHSEATCRKVIDACIRRGVLTDWFLFAPHCMRLAPPLVITEGELETACRRILAALDEVAASGG
jgi:acetylornithine/succinyldiaminopimelate/putrescine aminotransferase